jgi:GT2 family glycosyltransferase
MDVSIIIVSYNTAKLLDECIDSIKSQTSVEYEIIVVDNNSTDSTLEILKEKHADIILIENKINNGFASANNQGIDIAKGKYVFLFNPDTVVLDSAVDKLHLFMEENPDIGICGPKNLGADLKLQMNCDHFPSLWNIVVENFSLGKIFPQIPIFNKTMMRYWEYDCIREVDRITGCSILVRKSIFNSIGKLDDKFFMYFEETDFCLRVKRGGYKVVFYPNAAIIHYGGQSALQGKRNHIVNTTALNYYLPSRYLFFRKHHGKIAELALRIIELFYGSLLWLKNLFRYNSEIKKNRISLAKILIRLAFKY